MPDRVEAADLIRYYCQQLDDHDGFARKMGQLSANEHTRSVLKPYGVWAVISPFNFPMALAAGPAGGALVAGNTVVLKPSPQGSFTGYRLYECLRDAGLQISIDDFGTGYSSFSSMCDLPIAEIKIDRSFVTRMARGSEGEEVVRAIVAMGRAMGKRIVAEGIETELQCKLLTDLGCDGGQGYLFARPLTPWDVEAQLKQARPRVMVA